MVVILHGMYAIYAILLWGILTTITDWILLDTVPPVSFSDLSLMILYSLFLGYIAIKIMNTIRIEVLKNLKLINKIIISTDGMYIGTVKGVSKKDNKLIVETPFGSRFTVPLSHVKNMIENRLFVKM